LYQNIWIKNIIGDNIFYLLNLDDVDIQTSILDDIKSDTDVYYDERWKVTETFSRFILKNPHLVENKDVLVLGAGIGMETVVIGRLAHKIYLNDLSSVALNLCVKQLVKNRVNNYEIIHGRYESIELPEVDIMLGSFLVYNLETYRSMKQIVENCHYPILLMNEPFNHFMKLIRNTARKSTTFSSKDECLCVLFN